MKTLLIANRGEIAIRIINTARDLGFRCIAVAPEDDLASAHVIHADAYEQLPGAGAAAYLDLQAVLDAAQRAHATAIHPGYGFLSEQPEFATACEAANLTFVGPTPTQLQRFGNKAGAKSLAAECNVPLIPGTEGATTCLLYTSDAADE